MKQNVNGDHQGIQVSYGGKSFNLCDPTVLYLAGKTQSERFTKYLKSLCATNSIGDIISSYSKNGKLKALVQAYKGGISIDVLEKLLGKRGNFININFFRIK